MTCSHIKKSYPFLPIFTEENTENIKIDSRKGCKKRFKKRMQKSFLGRWLWRGTGDGDGGGRSGGGRSAVGGRTVGDGVNVGRESYVKGKMEARAVFHYFVMCILFRWGYICNFDVKKLNANLKVRNS